MIRAALVALLVGAASAETGLEPAFDRARELVQASPLQARKQALVSAGLDEDAAWKALMTHSGISGRFYRAVEEGRLFEAALDGIRRGLVPGSAEESAVRGMVLSLGDPHSLHRSSREAAEHERHLGGRPRGSGVHKSPKRAGEGWRVAALHPKGGGAAAGLREGDVILAIGGRSIVELDEGESSRLWREAVDADALDLRYRRGEEDAQARVALSELEIESAAGRRLGDFVYLYVYNFTPAALERARAELARLDAASARGLVLDLRRNPGGNVEALRSLAGEFLPAGTALLRERARGEETVVRVDETGALQNIPLAVLVDRDTASAAEAFASAVQERGRGAVVGETTTGKGTVQLTWGGWDGPAITLTVAEWRTGLGRVIQDAGVVPSAPVAQDDAGRAGSFELLHRLVFGLPAALEDDPVVRRALSALSGG